MAGTCSSSQSSATWLPSGPATRTAPGSGLRLCGFAKYAPKDRVDVPQVSIEREDAGDLFFGQMRAYFFVRRDQRMEVAVFVPGLHRVALHPSVGGFAPDAALCQNQQ